MHTQMLPNDLAQPSTKCHVHIYAYMHTYIHTYTHTYIHTQMLPDYLAHLATNRDSLLCRMFGLFRIKPEKRYFLIMCNVLDSMREINTVRVWACMYTYVNVCMYGFTCVIFWSLCVIASGTCMRFVYRRVCMLMCMYAYVSVHLLQCFLVLVLDIIRKIHAHTHVYVCVCVYIYI